MELDENEPGPKTQRYFETTRDGKLLLRRVMERYVPEEVTDQVKQGFSGPDASWFRGDSIDYVRETILDPDAAIYELPRPGRRAAARRGAPRGPREPAAAAVVAAQLRALVQDLSRWIAALTFPPFMRVLITGATGFVGGHLLRALASTHELFATARRAVPAQLAGFAEWIEADLTKPLDGSALPARVDAVVHLAQSERFAELPDQSAAEEVIAVNLTATGALLAHAREAGARRFVYASTGGVYARSEEPIREDGQLDPQGAYFVSKLDGERLLGGAEDLLPIVLRPFFVYGPGQRKMLVAGLFDRVLAGDQVTVAGDPGLRSNPVFVGDAVSAIEAALTSESGGTYNLAGPEAASITELVELIAEVAGVEPRIAHAPGGSEGDLVADIARLGADLVAPRTGLREGLEAMLRERRTETIEG